MADQNPQAAEKTDFSSEQLSVSTLHGHLGSWVLATHPGAAPTSPGQLLCVKMID